MLTTLVRSHSQSFILSSLLAKDRGTRLSFFSDMIFFFFFSSRRRHTRFKCDWSSDVCSSDLMVLPSLSLPAHAVTSYRAGLVTGDSAYYELLGTYGFSPSNPETQMRVLGVTEIGRASCRERV